MFKKSLTGWTKSQLRNTLLVFFLALSLPTGFLIYQTYSQLKWQAFHRHQLMAEEFTSRVNQRLIEIVNLEESRTFTDYSFLNVVGDPTANFFQPSLLSSFPVSTDTPGLLGYFQIDVKGLLSTPLLPENEKQSLEYGISVSELSQRRELQNKIQEILTQNSLVNKQTPEKIIMPTPNVLNEELADTVSKDEKGSGMSVSNVVEERESFAKENVSQAAPQAAFDELSRKTTNKLKTLSKNNESSTYGRVEDLKLESRFQVADKAKAQTSSEKPVSEKRMKRAEQNALPEQKKVGVAIATEDDSIGAETLQVKLFESEIDPFSVSLLDSGHLVLFRKVWRDNQRYIQGLLLEPSKLIEDVIERSFRKTNLAKMSNLAVAFQGDILAVIDGQINSSRYDSTATNLNGALLYQNQLTAPLNNLELVFSIKHLPAGPAGTVINWLAVILSMILLGGFLLMYRMGLTQINLIRQQQDFVSAVSHELKTPLTSIRMYGEMLREGWAEEDKKKTYYNYIYDESERLTRLINNVLQLARMNRNDLHAEMKPTSVNEILDMVKSKISSSVEQAGYRLNIKCNDQAKHTVVQVDLDFFNQIMINLVDNAIKFSSKQAKHEIDIGCQVKHTGAVEFSVRDYGPGVKKDQMRKIFKLFYRSENELTRETLGTGIGLALVHQLAQTMNAKVDVVNYDVGAEFRILF
ncbi:MAG: sensor histidine kinase [Gammaproteobacteria bacterium]